MRTYKSQVFKSHNKIISYLLALVYLYQINNIVKPMRNKQSSQNSLGRKIYQEKVRNTIQSTVSIKVNHYLFTKYFVKHYVHIKSTAPSEILNSNGKENLINKRSISYNSARSKPESTPFMQKHNCHPHGEYIQDLTTSIRICWIFFNRFVLCFWGLYE